MTDHFNWLINEPCPHCGAMMTETLAWRINNPGAPCAACGQAIVVEWPWTAAVEG